MDLRPHRGRHDLRRLRNLASRIGGIAVTICLTFFAFTTALGWCVYGERSAIFLFGDRVLKPFRILYTIVVPIGALAQLDLSGFLPTPSTR